MKSKQVACILIRGPKDTILMGKRRDNKRYTQPGGHIEPNESPLEAAHRELEEETGLQAKSMKLLTKVKNPTNGYEIFVFEAQVDDPETTVSDDPDSEVHSWDFLDPLTTYPLHVPLKHNVLLKYWIKNPNF